MAAARAISVALLGIEGQLLRAQATLDTTDPAPGLLDRLAAAETRDRIRAAVHNSGLRWPDRPVTLTTTPAVPSSSLAGCDLAWACAVLAADGTIPTGRLQEVVLLGELSLDGRIRPVRGVLPALLAAQRAGLRHAIVPSDAVAEAAPLPAMQVWGADRLADVAAWFRGGRDRLARPVSVVAQPVDGVDVPEVFGQQEGTRAVEITAAGGHHLLLVGLPGAGTTLLVRRLAALLPPLTPEQALEVTAIHSVAGTLAPEAPLITIPPLVAPHHSTSTPTFVGGGVGIAKPGAISTAHRGILFLDQAPEFGADRWEALRTALDEGEIRLARRDGVARYPTRFQLILGARPCPCGAPEPQCACSPHGRRRYLARLSGPLLDRIDLRVRLRPPAPLPADTAAPPDPTVVERVRTARDRAAHRWATQSARTNAEVPAAALHREYRLPPAVTTLLEQALSVGSVTRRGADRCLRVAWTLADLASLARPGADQIAEALAWRDRRPSSATWS